LHPTIVHAGILKRISWVKMGSKFVPCPSWTHLHPTFVHSATGNHGTKWVSNLSIEADGMSGQFEEALFVTVAMEEGTEQ
jgi:hypothetical protein